MVFSKPFWEVLVRPVVLPFLLVALVDGALTVYGTSSALGGSPTFSLAAGLVVGLGVLIILLSTFDIWGTWHPVLRESEFMTLLLRCLWAGGPRRGDSTSLSAPTRSALRRRWLRLRAWA